jgi:VCBS repeat-containing protein
MTTILPAYTIGGITRPPLYLDSQGNIVLTPAASDFIALYGVKLLYVGVPPGTPYPPVTDSLSTPVNLFSAPSPDTIAEGAPVNTQVGLTLSATSPLGSVTYSLIGDSSGGGFKVDANSGVVTVADPTKIDFESAPGHAYTVTAQATDGILTVSKSFTINVTDVAPTTPVDANAAANAVLEGAAVGTVVGLTASSTDVNGPAVHYSLTGDSSGGGFKIDANTGVVTVADSTKIDFESSPGHAYTVTATASDGTLTSSKAFTINVVDVPLGVPADINPAANQIAEGAAVNTAVGITAHGVDPNGPATIYTLTTDTSGGGFKIDPVTGVVTVNDPTKIDFESAPGHGYSITVKASDGVETTTQTFSIAVTDVAPSVPVDSNATANSVVEGAAAGTSTGLTVSSTDVNGPAVTYSLTGDTSGGGFKVDPSTGVVTVADPTKIDFESAPGHAYTVTAMASDGTLASSQTFTIGVTDLPPSTPVDSDATANSVVEGAPVGTVVGITLSSTDVNGPAVTYSLTGDTSNGGFKVDPHTGVVTVADPTKLDFESTAPGHQYTITAQASDGAGGISAQNFTIGVTDAPPSLPVDSDATANSVLEGAAVDTLVGLTVSSTDVNGPPVTYTLTADTSNGGFKIDPNTGVVTVNDPTKIDFESAPGHVYTVTATASDGQGGSNSQNFIIGVGDVPPSVPVDSDLTSNSVAEDAPAGTTVGITASSTDINGPAVTYSLTVDTSNGGFKVDPNTGVVTVNDPTKIDFETSPSHQYTVTVGASDGTDVSTQNFTIDVTNVNPSTPTDSDLTANSVLEGAPTGTAVGVTVSSTDPNGPPVTYTLTSDPSNGGFAIDPNTGVVTVADPTKLDFESTAPGHSFTITAQASDGAGGTSSQNFTIGVADAPPSAPVDNDNTANSVQEGAAAGTAVGITALSTDVNGGAVTYSLTNSSNGAFAIDPNTGVITVADPTKIDFETAPGHQYTVTAQASDGTLPSTTTTFTIDVGDVAPTTPIDSDPATNQVSQNGLVGTYAGVTASSTDINGPAVTYEIVTDTSGGGFAVDPNTGKVTIANPADIASPGIVDVTVDATDGTLHSGPQTFAINVIANTPPVANADSVSATEAGGVNNGTPGHDLTVNENVILGTGDAGNVQDTDAEDPSTALTVVAVHTGPEGGSTGTGTVGSPLAGSFGTLTLNSNGSYTYTVDQNNPVVQALPDAAHTVTDQFNYTIQDTGGLQDTANLTITIHGADDLPLANPDTGTMTQNDAPTLFNVIANDSQDPDSTAPHPNTITIAGGVTVAGPAGETFVNTDATASVVSGQVQVSLINAHFQQLAQGEDATVTVPYTLTGDTGETSTANLVVTVNGINDVPVAVDDSGTMTEDQSGHAFSVLTNDTLDPDHGAPNNVTLGTVTNLAAPSGEGITLSDISVSVNGSNQVVVNLGSNFQHMQDGQTTTFDIPYTLHGDQPTDAANATLHVTVTGVNDAPTANDVTFNGADSANYNTDLVVNDPTDGAPTTTGPFKGITASLLSLSNASDVDGPNALSFVPGTITTTDGGKVVLQADGDFVFTPKVGDTHTSDSFQFTVTDGNTPTAGTVTKTATIALQGPHIWYVNADAATDGDGSSEHPFNTLAHFANTAGNNVDSAGDTIFLETSTAHYTGGLALENNETLISQSAGLVVPDGGGEGGTVTLVAAGGANAVVDGGVTLASGNDIQGVDFGSSSTFSLSGTNVGTSTIDNVKQGVINNTGSGGAVSIGGSGNALTYDFGSVTSSGGTNGIVLNGASGTFHAHGGTISGASGADVSLSSGTLNFTDDGAITDTTGTVVSISGMTAGTDSFTGAITGGQVSLTSNTGATVDFSGGMNLSTGASNAFSATGGGTLNVTGTNNHLTTTTGTALNVANTTIGSSNLNFHDINANGAVNGIVLNTTGTSGGLTVTGDGNTSVGGNASGGTIQETTGAGIELINTFDPSFNDMKIQTTAGSGIDGNHGVTNFSFTHGTIDKSGLSDALAITGTTGTSNISFNNGEFGTPLGTEKNISGTVTITDSVLNEAYYSGLDIYQFDGTISNANISNNSITSSTDITKSLSTGISIALFGSTTTVASLTQATIDQNTITNFPSNAGILVAGGNASGTGTPTGPAGVYGQDAAHQIQINNNTIAGQDSTHQMGTQGINFSINAQASGNFLVDSNHVTNVKGIGIAYGGNGVTGSVLNATISNNVIDANNIFGSSGIGGGSASSGFGISQAPVDNVNILSNNVKDTNGPGIFFNAIGASAHDNVKIDNNIVGTPTDGSGTEEGIKVSSGNNGGDNEVVSLEISGNTTSGDSGGGLTAPGIGLRKQGTNPSVDAFNIVGMTAGSQSSPTIENFVNSQNPNSAAGNFGVGGTVLISATSGFVGIPTLPQNLLAAASGGVESSTPTSGEMHLTQTELDSIVAAAINQWALAGATPSQLAALHNIVFTVADLPGATVADETPGHITVDVNAAGHGWFVDPTPGDNFEFTHAANAAGTDLFTDPASAAAGHLDLLTAVSHEMGHVLGLPDGTSASDVHDLMYISLADGERHVPSAADVLQALTLSPNVGQAGAALAAPPQGGVALAPQGSAASHPAAATGPDPSTSPATWQNFSFRSSDWHDDGSPQAGSQTGGIMSGVSHPMDPQANSQTGGQISGILHPLDSGWSAAGLSGHDGFSWLGSTAQGGSATTGFGAADVGHDAGWGARGGGAVDIQPWETQLATLVQHDFHLM